MLIDFLDKGIEVFENFETSPLSDVYGAMVTIIIFSKIYTEIKNGQYSFWLSCTAP